MAQRISRDEPEPGVSRTESAERRVEYTSETIERLESFADETESPTLDVTATDLEAAYAADDGDTDGEATAVPVPDSLVATQADLTAGLLDPTAADRAADVAAAARDHADREIAPSAYVATYAPAIDRLIDDAFASVDGEDESDADLETVRETLRAGLKSTLVDVQIGVDKFAATEPESDPDEASDENADNEHLESVGLETVFDAIPNPAFLIDDENTVLYYNRPYRRLLNLDADHRDFLGDDCRETLAAATYSDGRRHHTLADKVAENPRDADAAWDVERVDDDYGFADRIVYGDQSTMKDHTGAETHIEFLAMPLFDADGELVTVLELIYDRTDAVRRQQSVEQLIGEVTGTLRSIGDGDLSARADFHDQYGVVDPTLLELTGEVNDMAHDFEELVERVNRQTDGLAASIERTTESAHEIDGQVTSQNQSLEAVATELEEFSATMEEVAASSGEVADAADEALSEADRGVAAIEDATDVTDEILESSAELVETVETLDESVDEIGDVAEVIADVADQTNLLALNANIEAAKASDDGAGFAVVANEVKRLAEETQEHTEEIATRIEHVQQQARKTVDEVETSHEQVRTAESEIRDVVQSFSTISDSVQTAADGIQEVSNANDDQAATVEEVMATVKEVQRHADTVAETTDEIVVEFEKQEQAVIELTDRIHELSAGQ
ncbi:PAS domain-containing protein [Haloterrigena salifodinae]|uniref:PAS domain-containing protein n=1 Tax=Haloterrigena salifodinae TaxID=2675099 RepID=A0A8T8E2C2_9EURY|nr:methyl-accepting chemotaxis protein [Haloterrigena salifodinae]QRV15908.1 PAS domain-containing protein [Haloterrigena salifodinae]